MSSRGPEVQRWPLLVRIVRARPRLFSSAALGLFLTAGLTLLTGWRPATRLLASWDLGVTFYLVLAFRMMVGADVHHIRRRAARQDEGRFSILVLTVVAALASLAAILVELSASPGGGGRRPMQLALATATIMLSWAFIHTIFALH